MSECDVAIIGGGIVGCSVAWGLVQRGLRIAVFDQGDSAHRASRGNFGMVWVQGKGLGYAPYARLTRLSADGWPEFSARLIEASGVDPVFGQPGGLGFCLSEGEFQAKSNAMARLREETEGLFEFEMRRAADLRAELPWLGPEVVGAVYCPTDGGANPLALLLGLQTALARSGAGLHFGQTIAGVAALPGGDFAVTSGDLRVTAGKVLLAAGLGNAGLAAGLGLVAPVRPVRGQIMVTERMAPFMPYMSDVFRQMDEGSCLIGDTTEEVGFDEGVLPTSLAVMATRAARVCPALGKANLVRSWGALRVMTPDGLPIYAQSRRYPGAWLATVHSGITLAPAHAQLMTEAIASGSLPEPLTHFSAGRFSAEAIASQFSSH